MFEIMEKIVELCNTFAQKGLSRTLTGDEAMCYNQCLNTIQAYMKTFYDQLDKNIGTIDGDIDNKE